ncbi:MAG: tetratricopeptide repeat protein [Burkholderiales bacterium]
MSSPVTELSALRDLVTRGRFAEAERAARALLPQHADDAELHFLLGIAQAEQRDFAAARKSVDAALRKRADAPWSWALAQVNVARDAGDPVASEAAARALVAREPRRPPVHNALGLALAAQHRVDEALAAFAQAAAIDPRYAAAYVNAASALQDAGRLDEATRGIESALTTLPDHPVLSPALGRLREAAGRRDDAKALYADAIRRDAAWAGAAAKRLGRLHYHERDFYSAIDAWERAAAADPRDVELWNWLGNAYLDVAALAHAARCFKAALALQPDYAEIHDNLLLCHHYDPKIGAGAMFDAHVEWARRFAAVPPVDVHAAPSGRLRVGLLSRSLCRGPTGFFLLPLLAHLDRNRFDVVAYSSGAAGDELQRQLRAHCAEWHDVGGDGDDALARRIAADAIDVLIDLDGHAPGNRLRAVARKPAPVILTWLDYFDTTGVAAVDFLVGDSLSVPPDGPQRFTERVLRVEPSRLCYAPPDYAPPPSPPPSARNGHVTFGSFNRLSKLAEPVVDAWARLLRAVPRSRLLLKSVAFEHANTRAVFAQRFVLRGVAADRLELRAGSEHARMLGEYADVDVALDPFPYNGGLTTCEALWMGVPLVARLGASMISRQSAALLAAAGLDRWIARDDDEWLRMNVELASDPDALAAFRRSARSRLAASPLVDGARFARQFEAMLEAAVRLHDNARDDDQRGRT